MRPPLPEEIKNGMVMANVVSVTDKMIEINQLNEVGLNEVLLLFMICLSYLSLMQYLCIFTLKLMKFSVFHFNN